MGKIVNAASEQFDVEQEEEEVHERDLVENYVRDHELETTLNEVINQVVADRPEDPFLMLSTLLYAKATSKRGIFHVQVREILDGNGDPTVLVRLHTGKGVFEASCSSETPGIPDKTEVQEEFGSGSIPASKQRFSNRGYRATAEKAELILSEKLLNMEPTDQDGIDTALLVLETTIGRNISHAASIAACKAGAKYADVPLMEYIAKLHDMPLENICLPMPLFSIVNGGKYASNKLFPQEIFILPSSAASFADAVQIGAEYSKAVKEQLENRGVGFTNVGTFGGFAPQLQTVAETFQILRSALEATQSKLENGVAIASASASPLRIDFGIDISASEFALAPAISMTKSATDISTLDDENISSSSYNTDKWVPESSESMKSNEEMLEMVRSYIKELNISAIVDPFDKADVKTFAALLSSEHDQDTSADAEVESTTTPRRALNLGGDPNCRVQIVAKTLLEYQGLEIIHEERACNTILVHLHQFPTLSQALRCITDARRLGLSVILGAVAGQNSDAEFLAAFSLGTGTGQVKFGGVAASDCVARYNQLLLAVDDFGAPIAFVADAYRR